MQIFKRVPGDAKTRCWLDCNEGRHCVFSPRRREREPAPPRSRRERVESKDASGAARSSRPEVVTPADSRESEASEPYRPTDRPTWHGHSSLVHARESESESKMPVRDVSKGEHYTRWKYDLHSRSGSAKYYSCGLLF